MARMEAEGNTRGGSQVVPVRAGLQKGWAGSKGLAVGGKIF